MQAYGRWTTEKERADARAKRLRFAIDYPDVILTQSGDAPDFKRARAPRAKAFAERTGPGYGGGAWPFSVERAMRDQGYRNGLRKAITNTWADDTWRAVAKSWFLEMMSDLIALEMIAEAADAEEKEKKNTSQ